MSFSECLGKKVVQISFFFGWGVELINVAAFRLVFRMAFHFIFYKFIAQSY